MYWDVGFVCRVLYFFLGELIINYNEGYGIGKIFLVN